MVNAGTYSRIDEILDQQRRRSDELDAETKAAQTELRAEIDERGRVLEEQQAEAERIEAEKREAEEAVLRERAREEHISIGEGDDDDPFAGRTKPAWAAPPPSPEPPARQTPTQQTTPQPPAQQAQPHQPAAAAGDPKWQVKAGRFGRREDKEEQPEQPAVTPPPKPAPRRRQVVHDDWDDDDMSGRSWLQ